LGIEEASVQKCLYLILAEFPADLTPFRGDELVQNEEEEKEYRSRPDLGTHVALGVSEASSRGSKLRIFEFLDLFFSMQVPIASVLFFTLYSILISLSLNPAIRVKTRAK